MAIDDNGVNVKVTAENNTQQGFEQVKQGARNMAQSVASEAGKASNAVDKIGNGGAASSKKVEASTRSMIQSIQRTTAAMEAGSRSSAQYYETLANQRGISTDALRPYLAQLEAVEAKQKGASGALASGAVQMDKYGMSAKATAAAMRGVPAQLTDIMVSLQGGQRPMTVLMQQGGQLKDMFGGIVPAARALGTAVLGMINPFTLAASAAGALYMAYRTGAAESEEFNRTLITTGNAIGLTTEQLNGMAQRIDGVVGTQRNAAAALNEFARSIKISSGNLEDFAATAIRWEQATGQAVAETVKQFEELGKAPLQASLKLNESMNYLTDSIYEQIKALEDQGRETEAAELAQIAFADALDSRTPQMLENIGAIERGWNAIKRAVSEAVDAMAGIGRASTLQQQLTQAEAGLSQMMDGAYERGAARRMKQVEAQRALIASIQEQISLESGLAMVQKQADQERARSLKAIQDVDAYVSDSSRMSRAAQMEKALNDERQIYEKRVQDAAGNADKLTAIEQAYQTKVSSIRDQFAEKEAKRAGGSGGSRGKSEAQRELERQQREELRMIEAFERERAKLIDGQRNEIAAIEEKTRRIEDEIAMYGMGQAAIDALAISRLEEQRAMLAGFDNSEQQIELLDREIAARKRLMAATSQKEALDANKRAAEEAARDWERITDQIGQSLTDALMRGFEDGKGFAENFRDTLTNIFRTMVLRPVIDPIVKQASGTVQSLTGTGPKVGEGGIPDTSFLRSNSFQPGASMGTEFMANQWGRMGGDSMEALIAGNSSNWGVTSNMSSNIGAGMGYAGAIYALTEKQYATAIGTAVGTYIMPGIGTAIGSLIGNFVDGMIGDKLVGETRAGAQYGLAIDGQMYNSRRGTWAQSAPGVQWLEGPSGGGDREEIRATVEATTTGINELFRIVGADVSLSGFWAGFEGSEKRRGGVGAGGSLSTGGVFGEYGAGDNYKGTLFDPTRPRSLTAEEAANMLPAQLAQASLQAWQAAAEQMPGALAQMLKGVDFAGMGDEALIGLRDQFVAIVAQADQLRAALTALPFVPATAATFDFATALMQAAGGAENAANLLGSYYQSYFSEAERMGFLTEQLTGQFEQMGMTLPQTRDEFRGLVEANMALGEAGAKTVASLLGLGEGLNTLIAYTDQAAQAVAQAAQAQSRAAQAAIDDAQRQAYEAAVAARQAAESAASDAMSILTNAINARKSELQRAFDEIAEGLRTAITSSESSLRSLSALANTLQSTLNTMAGQADAGMNRAAAQGQIERAISVAKLTGVLPDAEALRNALQTVAQPSEGLFSTLEDYQADFLKTANDIGMLNGLTEQQISTEESILASLKDQLETAESQFEQEMAKYDEMLELAQQQLAAAMGTQLGIMSVEGAMANLAAALRTLKATPVPTPPSAGQNTADAYINGIYQDLFGRQAEQAGLDYWKSAMATGAFSADQLAQAIREGALNEDKKKLRGFAVGTNYVPYDMTAQIHEGERIIPAADNRELMSRLSSQDGNSAALLAEVRRLNAKIERLEEVGVATARHTNRTAKAIERAMPDGDALAVREAIA